MSHTRLQTAMIERACPLCGHTAAAGRVFLEAAFDLERLDRFAFASRKLPEYMHFRLLECGSCDVLFASPVPVFGPLADLYRDADFDSADESRYAARTYAGLLPAITSKLADRVGALDIGTGDGTFLERLLADGFSGVVGIEPSSAPIAAAAPEVRPLIRQGLFRPDDFEREQFRLVTCFQTLEHVADPRDVARGAFTLLKPNGAAFFIVHNRRAVSARALGSKSPIYDIEHFQLFSPKSARSLLERCGFVDVTVRPIVNVYPIQYWLKLAPVPLRLKRPLLAALQRSGVGRLPVALPVGNLAAIGYKPVRRVWPRGVARVDPGVHQ